MAGSIKYSKTDTCRTSPINWAVTRNTVINTNHSIKKIPEKNTSSDWHFYAQKKGFQAYSKLSFFKSGLLKQPKQTLQNYCVMKSLLKNKNLNNSTNAFAKFQNVVVAKKAQNQVKGGGDIIIEEFVDM